MKARRLRIFLRAFAVLVLVLILAGAALYLSTPDVAWLADTNPRSTAYIERRRDEARAQGRSFEPAWHWVPLEAVAPVLRRAVILAEDRRFRHHGGVDAEAVHRVLRETLEDGRPLRGASTITQQLARNLFLSPDRSLIRKLREAVVAWRLEAALDKDRILELYLNVAEWGDATFGAEAAARRYYACSAAELTPAQAARLAVALPNPFRRAPDASDDRLVYDAACLVARLCLRGELEPAVRDAAFAELGVTDATRPPAYLLVSPDMVRR